MTQMAPDELARFYQAALTAGSILSGFNGTFISFRIRRESDYYRQPAVDFESRTARDVSVGLSRFNSSFLLIILGALCSLIFGIFLPLSSLAHWSRFTTGPAPILAGIVASAVLVGAYFFDELIHYEIIKWSRLKDDLRNWEGEWLIVVTGIFLAALLFVLTYCALSH